MPLTVDEKRTAGEAAKKALDRAKTREEVVKVWQENFGTLGHKALGRLLLGQEVDAALKLTPKA